MRKCTKEIEEEEEAEEEGKEEGEADENLKKSHTVENATINYISIYQVGAISK